MITEKRQNLKSILESSGGIHLTSYLVNRGDLADLKRQLRTTIQEAYEWLQPVMGVEERKKFLEPLDSLLNDARIFKEMKGNIGLFRTVDSFRILSIPVDVQRGCMVATSFHVKPILRWMQIDREFLVLGLDTQGAHLYLGSQNSLQKVDSILFPTFFAEIDWDEEYRSLKESREVFDRTEGTFKWINDWVLQITKHTKPKLFIAGKKTLTQATLKHLTYRNLTKTPVWNSFSERDIFEVSGEVRKIVRSEAKVAIDKALLEFRFAEDLNLAKKNIFQISKAASQGKVKKLIIANEMNVFGKIDKKTGGLAIHPFDMDHEDDDILDDLAQTVLEKGGEVIVASREEIPKGRPVLAILEDPDWDQEFELVQKGASL